MCVSFLLRLVSSYIDFICNRQPCCPLFYIWILNSWRLDVWLVHVIFIYFFLTAHEIVPTAFITVRVVFFLLSRHYLFISNATRLYLNPCFRCHLAASDWLDSFGCQHLLLHMFILLLLLILFSALLRSYGGWLVIGVEAFMPFSDWTRGSINE